MSWLGRVTTTIRFHNGTDKPTDREALVDTGAETLGVPADLARELHLEPDGHRTMASATGSVQVPWVRALRIEVLGRSITTDAVITPEGTPVLLGCKQLEQLGLNVYPREKAVR